MHHLVSSVVLLVVRTYSMVSKNVINVAKYFGTSRLLMALLHDISLVFFFSYLTFAS